MMKSRICVLAIVFLALGLVALPALAKDQMNEQKAVGTIVSVAEDFSSFDLKMGEGEQAKTITVTTDENTAYEIDGEAAEAADVLVVDARVKVTHTDGLATLVAAKPKGDDKAEDAMGDDATEEPAE